MNSHNEIDYVRDKSCDCFSEGGEDVCPGRLNSDEGVYTMEPIYKDTPWTADSVLIRGVSTFLG